MSITLQDRVYFAAFWQILQDVVNPLVFPHPLPDLTFIQACHHLVKLDVVVLLHLQPLSLVLVEQNKTL